MHSRFLVARILQTVIHLAFEQTNTVAAWRFAFFFIQALCMVAMAAIAIFTPSA
jgi:hypothetical protein